MYSLAMLLVLSNPAVAADPGTVIANTARAAYGAGIVSDLAVYSNTELVTTVVNPTPSMLEFLQYAPIHPAAVPTLVSITEYSVSGNPAGPFVGLPPPMPLGSATPLDLGVAVPLIAIGVYHQGEPIFLRLIDPDQNRNSSLRETVLISLISSIANESELIRMTETGPSTGIFTGYIHSVGETVMAPADGLLSVEQDCLISIAYADVYDASDTSSRTTPVDPTGVVFDSHTGQPVNGAIITLLQAGNDEPAQVYGDDGVSDMPASLVSGGQATDSGGTEYQFPPGRFRFPFVAPGE
jgi:hypothetical protein